MDVSDSMDASFLPKERLVRIFDVIEQQGSARVADLASQFGASLMTIRRDLTELEQKGLVVRTHGGVVLRQGILQDYDANVRQRTHVDLKRAIARAALQFVEPGDVIALDASTTVVECAKCIADIGPSGLTVVTNNFLVANVLMRSPIEIFFAGGRLRREACSTVGHAAETMISQWVFDKAFVSGTAMDVAAGLMDSNADEVHMKQLMLRNSSKRYVLVDSSKLMRRAVTRVLPLADFDALVTDERIDDAIAKEFERANIRMVVAKVSDT